MVNTITISKKELKDIVKESIREILEQESMKYRASVLPWVSSAEQKDIEKHYGQPRRKVAKSVELQI